MAKIKYIDIITLKQALTKFLNGADKRFLGIDANAVSASKLQIAVKINGEDFDGTKDVNISAANISDFGEQVNQFLNNAEATHVHTNKNILDGITQEMLNAFATKIGTNDIELLLYTNENMSSVQNVKQGLDTLVINVVALTSKIRSLEEKDTTTENNISTLQQSDISLGKRIDDVESVIGQEGKDNVVSSGIFKKIEDGDTKVLQDAKQYADQQITNLVDSAPEAMNTLNELAKAINDHQDVYDAYVDEVSGELTKKVDKVEGKSLVDDAEIARLANVTNYNDTEVKGLIDACEEKNETQDNRLQAIESELPNKAVKSEVETALSLKANTTDFVTLTEQKVNTIINEVFGS